MKPEEISKFAIDEKIVHGLYLIMCSIGDDFRGAEVYSEALHLMHDAHKHIIEIGKYMEYDCRGGDLK